MSRIIDGLTAQYHTEALWLSNANSFYGYLAHRYSQSGASINLFEEGLGTYRSVNDPPFVRHHLRHRVSSLIGEVRAALTNPDLSLDRRVRRAGHRVVRFTGRTRPGELITEVLTLGRARHFIRPWTRFARAIVAFPSLLDPELVRSTTAIQLMIDATHTVDDEQKSAVDPAWVKDHESAIPVFLCQRYGVPMTIWGEAIASEILNLGIHEVLVKHHPRETPLEREEFIASLRDAGVSAVTSERFDTWPAEWLIYRGLTNHVIGLTSSTLVYRPPAPHHVTYSSLADGVLERLRHDARVPESTLTRFATDLAVFDRVFLRLAASQQ